MASPLTLSPVVVRAKGQFKVEVATPRTPFMMMVALSLTYQFNVVPWVYVAKA